MSIDLLKKKAETIGINLQKKGIVKVPPLRVVADYDVSGSMRTHYNNGTVQKVADQVLGAAYKFDDNGEVDTFIFDNDSSYIGTSKPSDYGTFVKEHVLTEAGWGSTDYTKCLQQNMDFLFGAAPPPKKKGIFGGMFKKDEEPVTRSTGTDPGLVLFFTDGNPDSNQAGGESVISAAVGKAVYFHLIGIGQNEFRQLKYLADKYDNCGFVHLKEVGGTDEETYASLVTDEFVGWLKTIGAS